MPYSVKLYKKIRGRKTTQYQNQIFVRKGTITTTANRYDLELMNYDRKNLNKPYQTHIFLRGFRDIALSPNKITSKVWLTIENLGFRPLAICQMKLNTKLSNKDVLHFKSTKLKSLEGARQNSDLITNPVVANPNTIVGLAIEFVTEKRVTGLNQDIFNTEKDKLKEVNGEILLTTNNKIYFDVIQSNSLND